MYQYDGTDEHRRRLIESRCRCASQGTPFKISSLIEHGRIRDPRDRRRLLTTPEVKTYRSDSEPNGSGYGKTFIYAVSENFDINIAPDSDRDEISATKHETLCRNADVRAAGEIHFLKGIINGLNDISGSYGTIGGLESNPEFSKSILKAIEVNNLPTTKDLIERLKHFTQSQP